MAATTIPNSQAAPAGTADVRAAAHLEGPLVELLRPLASLRLTVFLFALSLFLVLVGTLAQYEANMWEVLDRYFYAWLAYVPLQVFLPGSFFPSQPRVGGGFYFPGGAMLGLALFVNLTAAHAIRFRVQARGLRLALGLAVLALGVLITWMVIAAGHNAEGFQGRPPFEWSTLWWMLKLGLLGIWLVLLVSLLKLDKTRLLEFVALACGVLGLGVLLGWLFYLGDEAQLNDSSMRILWQLIQGTVAAAVLLVGCELLFKRRGGIVLLHGGMGLLMFGVLLVALTAVEAQMTIPEGQTVNYVRETRSLELAVVGDAEPGKERVVAVPLSLLARKQSVQDERLPFGLELVRFFKNTDFRPSGAGMTNPATAGQFGKQGVAVEAPASSGASMARKGDFPSAYVKLVPRQSSSLQEGVYLFPLESPDTVVCDEATYQVALRYKRIYKPYSVQLLDVRKQDYMGTDTPRDYSSDIRLSDPLRQVDREVKIWMNNPLRYAGETFYQSGYQKDDAGREYTTLAVVTNTGWMIPYVACMLVAVGMLAQFSQSLSSFLRRRRERELSGAGRARGEAGLPRWVPWALPALATVLGISVIAYSLRPPRDRDDGFDLNACGQLPVVYQGRVKPLDTLARNSLRLVSNRQTYLDAQGNKHQAMRWLLDVICDRPAAFDHPVFYVTNQEVKDVLGLPRRKSQRYSVNEILPRVAEFEKQVRAASAREEIDLSVFDRKILELDRRIRSFTMLRHAFVPLDLSHLPQFAAAHAGGKSDQNDARTMINAVMGAERELNNFPHPRAIPGRQPDEEWLAYATAANRAYLQRMVGMNDEVNPFSSDFGAMMLAYINDDSAAFNAAVAKYQRLLEKSSPALFDSAKTRFETYFNHAEPFLYASILYLLAGILSFAAWLGWSRTINRSAFWLILITLCLHTAAIVGRIYISGRPPVTNLYSSAVFVGWGCVVLGLLLEVVFRLGFGNVIAAISGFCTLLIAHILSGEGDTFVVMQAVLDTQFWLATHVVCISLGYSTTFLAGLFGMLYILRGVCTPSLTREAAHSLDRMIYGSICFAAFFSFVGTVLGGLWADDSWGRFWGWDPKENGALMIVLWNALVLHARWGRMVGQRGLATLAIGGNIVTAWSWFGVNELGIGLHSYGFTEGVLRTLLIVWLIFLAFMVVGWLWPQSRWWSQRRHGDLVA